MKGAIAVLLLAVAAIASAQVEYVNDLEYARLSESRDLGKGSERISVCLFLEFVVLFLRTIANHRSPLSFSGSFRGHVEKISKLSRNASSQRQGAETTTRFPDKGGSSAGSGRRRRQRRRKDRT